MSAEPRLLRAVGLWGLVAMCVNAVVGSGVFLLPHDLYGLLGPFSLWAPLIFALPVFVIVLCFAEAASHFTEPGGPYLYAREAFGDFVGFQTGWMVWIARVTSFASLSNGFVLALGLLLPGLASGTARIAVITATIVVLTAIHFAGIRWGAASIYVFTWGKLLPLIGFIVIALIVWRSNPVPLSLTIPGAGTDWNGAALLMLFAYAGFENLGVLAGECRNPRRDLPVAFLIGILAIAAIYALAQLAALSALPDLSVTKTPIASAAAELVGPAGAIVVTLGSLLSIAGTNSSTLLTGSRMLYALSLGRRMGSISRVHPTFRTPTAAILIQASLALALALGGTFARLAMLSAVARLTTFLVTCAAVPRLRKLNEGFRTPGLFLPVLGTLISLSLLFTMSRSNLLAAAVALGAGAVVYRVTTPRAPEERR